METGAGSPFLVVNSPDVTTQDKETRGKWLLALLRPGDWFPYLGLTMLGWSGTAGAPAPWITLLWSALYLAGGYGFNGVCDWRTDDAAKNPIRGSAVSPRAAGALSLALLLAPVPLAFALIPSVRVLTVMMVALGVVYSLPGWGLKRVAGVVSLANIALFVPLYWIGAGRMPEAVPGDLWVLGVLALPSLQSQLVHELGDRAEDLSSGRRSTASWLGENATQRLVQGLGIATLVIAALAWREGVLGVAAAALFALAGLVSAWAPSQPPLQWRRRIKVAYLVPCAAWLIEGIVARTL